VIAFDGMHACGGRKPKRCAGKKAITAPGAERTAAGATLGAGARDGSCRIAVQRVPARTLSGHS
jgi:hypothetical protein